MTWGESSALVPAGPQAARLAHLYWVFFAVCAVVYLTVIALLVLGMRRRDDPAAEAPAAQERRRLRLVALGGIATTVVLVALLIATVATGHGLNPLRGARDTTVVRVIARQWWWEFRYPGATPDAEVTTANELHIPVGRPVLLELVSRDVIHSFWVPALYGKRDLIPGHDSTAYIQADRPGLFHGQCAEFCGAQHAKMAFVVVAETSDRFEAWLSRQRQAAPSTPAALAAGDDASRGRELFLRGTCPMCHTVAGTVAGATMGPDLTHLATRLTLGAGSLANARDHLAAWIRDSQSIKPGNHMPPTPLAARQLADLVSYLETLR
jgi:cytochrome c oxidase subunit 2